MSLLLAAIFWSWSLAGHWALCAALVNRIHAIGMPRWIVKSCSLVGLILMPVGLMYWLFIGWRTQAMLFASQAQPLTSIWQFWREEFPLWQIYSCVLLPWMAFVAVIWARRKYPGDPVAFTHHSTVKKLNVADQADQPLCVGWFAKLCQFWPGNEVLRLHVEQHELPIPQLPPELDGLRIVHLSDMHFTGHISQRYFQLALQHVADLQPELIAITGDLVDAADCIDWLPETVGNLRAEHGIYYILGNHDSRTHNLGRIHRVLADVGIQDVGGGWKFAYPRGWPLLLAGNELPWLGPAADLRHAPVEWRGKPYFRVLLAHTPDQFGYAQRWNFPLMLAGHTHGGQIALPGIGPIFAPSYHGVRYAGGTFFQGGCVMHVSRGLSAELALRWNAPPEISLLKLVRGAAGTA